MKIAVNNNNYWTKLLRILKLVKAASTSLAELKEDKSEDPTEEGEDSIEWNQRQVFND